MAGGSILRISRPWRFAFEHSAWCIAWGVAAAVVVENLPDRGPTPGLAAFAAAFPTLVHGAVAFGIAEMAPLQASYLWRLLRDYGGSGETLDHLMPPVLNFLLLAVPTIVAVAILHHLVPSVRRRWCRPEAETAQSQRALWLVCLLSFGLASVCLLWPFIGVGRYLREWMRDDLGTATSSMMDMPTWSDDIAGALHVFKYAGLPFICVPFVAVGLRRLAAAGWRWVRP
jgi:hypothetical protein